MAFGRLEGTTKPTPMSDINMTPLTPQTSSGVGSAQVEPPQSVLVTLAST